MRLVLSLIFLISILKGFNISEIKSEQDLSNSDREKVEKLFFDYIDTNKKQYDNEAEYEYRFKVFQKNVKKILGDLHEIDSKYQILENEELDSAEENLIKKRVILLKGDNPCEYELSLNGFSDITDEEFQDNYLLPEGFFDEDKFKPVSVIYDPKDFKGTNMHGDNEWISKDINQLINNPDFDLFTETLKRRQSVKVEKQKPNNGVMESSLDSDTVFVKGYENYFVNNQFRRFTVHNLNESQQEITDYILDSMPNYKPKNEDLFSEEENDITEECLAKRNKNKSEEVEEPFEDFRRKNIIMIGQKYTDEPIRDEFDPYVGINPGAPVEEEEGIGPKPLEERAFKVLYNDPYTGIIPEQTQYMREVILDDPTQIPKGKPKLIIPDAYTNSIPEDIGHLKVLKLKKPSAAQEYYGSKYVRREEKKSLTPDDPLELYSARDQEEIRKDEPTIIKLAEVGGQYVKENIKEDLEKFQSKGGSYTRGTVDRSILSPVKGGEYLREDAYEAERRFIESGGEYLRGVPEPQPPSYIGGQYMKEHQPPAPHRYNVFDGFSQDGRRLQEMSYYSSPYTQFASTPMYTRSNQNYYSTKPIDQNYSTRYYATKTNRYQPTTYKQQSRYTSNRPASTYRVTQPKKSYQTLNDPYSLFKNFYQQNTFANPYKNKNEIFIQGVKIPTYLNWRRKRELSPVKNQGGCNACYAFGALSGLEAHNVLKNSDYSTFSEQEIIDCSQQNKGCKGGQPFLVYDYVKNNGISSNSQYPYTGTQDQCRVSSNKTGKFSGVKGYIFAKKGIANLLISANFGPVVVVSYAPDQLKYYYKGIFTGKGCDPNAKPNHASLLYGYNLKSKVPYLLFKNNWGRNWGDRGYYKVALGDLTAGNPGHCLIANTPYNTMPLL